MKTKRYHILIDLDEIEVDQDLLTNLLNELPGIIDMKILAGPVITNGMPENPGLSGFVIIDWSHISIHTFSNYNEILIDIFSCKEYDQEIVIKYLSNKLNKNPKSLQTKVVAWG